MSINVENLRLKFPDTDSTFFSNLNLTIKDKEKVLIVGPSGSGKSTLLKVLGKLIPEVISIPVKSDTFNVSGKPAYVFQNPDSQFTMPTVEEELAFVLENQNIDVHKMPELFHHALNTVGLEGSLTRSINELSGGMKQKLAIACTLLQGSDLLFLDEPTSMLDKTSAQRLWETIVNIWSDKTVVIVEHRVEFIWDIVDRIIVMDEKNQIIYTGTPKHTINECRDLLDKYGIWHPYSWENAPQLPQSNIDSEPILNIKNMQITRGKKVILSIPELSFRRGEWVTIEGANGSGKTSFMLAIMKLIKSKGIIHFKNSLIKKTKDYHSKVYPVFQNPELQFITHKVYDEVYINYEQQFNDIQTEEKTNQMLKRMGLYHVKELHPFELSTGQKRRLSVLTALTGQPEVIILDEPTFGLDQNLTFSMLELLHELVESGTTVLMITHDEEIKKRYPSRRLRIMNEILVEVGD